MCRSNDFTRAAYPSSFGRRGFPGGPSGLSGYFYGAYMTYHVPLSNGGYALVDDGDRVLVDARSWYWIKNKNTRYVRTGRGKPLHRILLGLTDSRVHVDHINGDGLDNRRANLRAGSIGDNLRNRHHGHGKSKLVGVYMNAGKWEARIKRYGVSTYLGRFDSEQAAGDAYQQAKAKADAPPCGAMRACSE